MSASSASATDLSLATSKKASAYDFTEANEARLGPSSSVNSSLSSSTTTSILPAMRKDSPAKIIPLGSSSSLQHQGKPLKIDTTVSPMDKDASSANKNNFSPVRYRKKTVKM